MLILASRSPRRRALLRAAGIKFRVASPGVEEVLPRQARANYAALVRRTALAKAGSVARRPTDVVLGADTVVVCDGELMGQPSSRADARRMLTRLSGRRHRVYTGVAVLRGPRRLVDYECTQVSFRRLSRREIDLYVRTGEPMGKAGAYAVQGKGAALVRAVRGCYTNVVGLPMPKVLEMLAQFEAGAWQMEEARRGRG